MEANVTCLAVWQPKTPLADILVRTATSAGQHASFRCRLRENSGRIPVSITPFHFLRDPLRGGGGEQQFVAHMFVNGDLFKQKWGFKNCFVQMLVVLYKQTQTLFSCTNSFVQSQTLFCTFCSPPGRSQDRRKRLHLGCLGVLVREPRQADALKPRRGAGWGKGKEKGEKGKGKGKGHKARESMELGWGGLGNIFSGS